MEQRPEYLNPLSAVKLFMTTANQTVNVLNAEQACKQFGFVLEEVGEGIETISEGCVTVTTRDRLLEAAKIIKLLADEFKKGHHVGDVLRCDLRTLLDDMLDTAWVGLGGAYSISHSTEAAFAHVAERNMAKFPDGKPYKDAHGKVTKPPGWYPPDHTPFVDLPQR